MTLGAVEPDPPTYHPASAQAACDVDQQHPAGKHRAEGAEHSDADGVGAIPSRPDPARTTRDPMMASRRRFQGIFSRQLVADHISVLEVLVDELDPVDASTGPCRCSRLRDSGGP